MCIKNLLIDVNCNSSFEYDNNSYEQGKTYFIMAEYSITDPTDVIDTTNWVLKMIQEGKFELKNPARFLPESNMISNEILSYMENFVEYCRSIL